MKRQPRQPRKTGPTGAVVCGAVALAWLAAPAAGQAYVGGAHPYSPSYLTGSAWDRLEPIDPGTADLGPLGLQARVLPMPMQRDLGFGMLYRAMTPDGSAMFARRDGGITAVFPRSAYVGTPLGEVPLIPPDTRFIIGEPSIGSSGLLGLGAEPVAARDPSNGLRLDGRITGDTDGRREVAPADRSGRVGVRALLERAAARERAGR